MFHISQMYESMVELIESRIWTLGLKKSMISLNMIKKDEISTSIETYYISNTNTECIGLQSFAPNWYRDLKSKKDIEKIFQRLEDI
jgi:hypothetical protein